MLVHVLVLVIVLVIESVLVRMLVIDALPSLSPEFALTLASAVGIE